MKIIPVFLSSLFIISLSGCGENETVKTSEETAESSAPPVRTIKSSTIYTRGREVAKKALDYEPGSKEREAELIRAHAIISTLEDSGYPESAADFKAGMKSML